MASFNNLARNHQDLIEYLGEISTEFAFSDSANPTDQEYIDQIKLDLRRNVSAALFILGSLGCHDDLKSAIAEVNKLMADMEADIIEEENSKTIVAETEVEM